MGTRRAVAVVLTIMMVEPGLWAQSPQSPKPAQADVAARNRAVLATLPFSPDGSRS